MSESFAVEPVPGSYVNEWVALQYWGPESFGGVKRLLKGTPWVAQLDLATGFTLITRVHQTGIEQWTVEPSEWLIRSPHDKVIYMDANEFVLHFNEAP
jgi:hypothetical protein